MFMKVSHVSRVLNEYQFYFNSIIFFFIPLFLSFYMKYQFIRPYEGRERKKNSLKPPKDIPKAYLKSTNNCIFYLLQGSNWIPAHVLPEKVTQEYLEDLLYSAKVILFQYGYETDYYLLGLTKLVLILLSFQILIFSESCL